MYPADKTPATKEDLRELGDELRDELKSNKDEILRHFDAVVEQIHHDLAGANTDEIETLKEEVIRIKTFVRLPAA